MKVPMEKNVEMEAVVVFTPHYTPPPQDSKRIFAINFIFFQRLTWRMVSHEMRFCESTLSEA